MTKKKVDRYNIPMSREEMTYLKRVLEWASEQVPYLPPFVNELRYNMDRIGRRGCFKHSIMTTRFTVSANETHTLCPKCNPKEFKEHEKQYKKE